MPDPYTLAGCVTGVLLLSKGINLRGSIFVALIWPVLVVMGLYYAVKLRVLGLRFRNDWVLDIEVLLCLCVACAAVIFYVLPAYS